MKTKVVPEKVIENEILKMLLTLGFYVWKNQSIGVFDATKKVFRKLGKYQIKGVSDILGILPDGRMLAIEVKSSTGRLSVDQGFFIAKINMNGGVAFTARSVGEVMDKLDLMKVSK
jgi:hypothetical protein